MGTGWFSDAQRSTINLLRGRTIQFVIVSDTEAILYYEERTVQCDILYISVTHDLESIAAGVS